jgi:hypothetical protein
MSDIIFTDPRVAELIHSVDVPEEPGYFEASCLADGCTWETHGYGSYVEDDCYDHVHQAHQQGEQKMDSTRVPLVEEFSNRHPSVVEALRWLDCPHLPEHLRVVAEVITSAVREVLPLVDDGPQLTRALHALTEAKDGLVRQRTLRRDESTGG